MYLIIYIRIKKVIVNPFTEHLPTYLNELISLFSFSKISRLSTALEFFSFNFSISNNDGPLKLSTTFILSKFSFRSHLYGDVVQEVMSTVTGFLMVIQDSVIIKNSRESDDLNNSSNKHHFCKRSIGTDKRCTLEIRWSIHVLNLRLLAPKSTTRNRDMMRCQFWLTFLVSVNSPTTFNTNVCI